MSFGQNFIDNLRQAHSTGEIPAALADAMADDLVWTSLAKSSLGSQSRGKRNGWTLRRRTGRSMIRQ